MNNYTINHSSFEHERNYTIVDFMLLVVSILFFGKFIENFEEYLRREHNDDDYNDYGIDMFDIINFFD